MSHHGNNPLPGVGDTPAPDVQKVLSEHMQKLLGEYPKGRLNDNDSGAIAMSVGVEAGRVILRFPKPVAWVGMTGDEAFEIAQSLLRHARSAGVTSPLVIRLGG